MPDANSRFRTSLWDIHGYLQETLLDRISNTQVVREINAERSYSFDISIRDLLYPLIKYRKIIRLHDTNIDPVSEVVSGYDGTHEITITGSSNADAEAKLAKFDFGDYIQVFEHAPQTFVARTTASETAGDNQTIVYENSSGTLTVGSFVKIIERIDEEKLVNNEYVRSPNAEVVEVLSVDTNTFNADLGYDYNAGAVILQPGRSFIAKVLNKYTLGGNVAYIVLSRRDFIPGSGAVIQKVNFETFRVKEITESRESGVPTASIRCDHITMDLNDTMFFKDTRVDISYASKGTGQVIQDRVDISTMLDNILIRHKDVSGNPISTKHFIKGDIHRFRYGKGTVSYGSNSTTLVGDSESDLQNLNISAGSQVYIENKTAPLTVAFTGSTDIANNGANGTNMNSVEMTSNIDSSSASNKKYLIVSKGTQTSDSLIGTCTINASDKKQLTTISFQGRSLALLDGRLSHGALVQFDGDNNKYYIV